MAEPIIHDATLVDAVDTEHAAELVAAAEAFGLEVEPGTAVEFLAAVNTDEQLPVEALPYPGAG